MKKAEVGCLIPSGCTPVEGIDIGRVEVSRLQDERPSRTSVKFVYVKMVRQGRSMLQRQCSVCSWVGGLFAFHVLANDMIVHSPGLAALTWLRAKPDQSEYTPWLVKNGEPIMASIDEISPGVHRISILYPEINLQFNHFLVVDDEPLLYHTGMRRMFPEVLEAVKRMIDPAKLRWIGFSHFEVDECGSLNHWLKEAPHAQVVSGMVGSLVNLNDFADRPPRALAADEVFSTGRFRFKYRPTPHLPHGWDAGVLFEETEQVLFCSDLFTHNGDVEPLTESEILSRARQSLVDFQKGPLMDYMPYTPNTRPLLEGLAALMPRVLATMHGSSFAGDCASALLELDGVMKEMLGSPSH